jgi:hypothetical protein
VRAGARQNVESQILILIEMSARVLFVLIILVLFTMSQHANAGAIPMAIPVQEKPAESDAIKLAKIAAETAQKIAERNAQAQETEARELANARRKESEDRKFELLAQSHMQKGMSPREAYEEVARFREREDKIKAAEGREPGVILVSALVAGTLGFCLGAAKF